VTTHMLSTRVLNNLSANLLAELKEIVGDKVDVFEPTMHTIYRTQLRPSEDKPRDPNWAKRGLSLEMVRT
jgi:hypothetical protein